MWIIIFSLILGISIGYFDILPLRYMKYTKQLTLIGLFLLLFTMGVGIGTDSQVINNLDELGLKAIVLAIGSVLGSLVFILFFRFEWNRED